MAILAGKNIMFLVGVILLLISVLLRHKKQNLSILLLTLAAFCLFFYAALLDNFLNWWDERFHAVVATNMTENPFKPMLFTSAIPDFDYDVWTRNLIWLHKQPMFLWQMALSVKLFGANILAIRLPSVLLATFLIPVSYRTTRIFFNKESAYYTALLFASSFFLFELVSGRQGMEHNDVSFLFYVSASIWAFAEYTRSGKLRWVILAGLFSGFAILTKWLVGFFVYLFWGLFLIFNKEIQTKKILHFILAFFITIIVALPWQLYIFISFPEEAYKEFVYNSLHFSNVLEGHGGNFFFYFQKITDLYGQVLLFLIIPSFVYLFSKSKFKWPVFVSVLFVYLFYSIAQTKMPAYPFVVSMLIFSGLGFLIYKIEEVLPKKLKFILVLVLIFLVYTNLRPQKIDKKHNVLTSQNNYTIMHQENSQSFEELKKKIPENAVIFNIQGRHYVEAMFYLDKQVYPIFPSQKQIAFLKEKGFKTVVVYNQISDVPYELQKNDEVILIKQKFHFFDT
jgi:4-amino-4-deoxy-L-arabinose transferase-like glycosyltransferase